jgi:GNAT superfamily N-acetyltransferase
MSTLASTTAGDLQQRLAEEFVAWALDFERRCMESGRPASRYFHADGLELYTRWSKSKLATGGRPTLVLANIEVAPELRGRGLFTGIMERLRDPATPLAAEALYVELVGEKRLAAWLARNGFQQCAIAEEGAPSFYRFRQGP